ncbi:hypothetical protein HELRODRAFT_178490 [Helobdella robusta]|uniref:Uncharacterized protein n=1 Tax=Helobdella robusta TaxID=6412 RepID=T1FD91_HELRO|nr:hypothetical protein HELRODRAFT_178490 [Helobdella robusta]ESN97044.1 hypothetical protein HELRODRAFT_178490 [Helobdella robusta]
MTQCLREDLRACGKFGQYVRQEGRNISFARPVYFDSEVCRRYCRPAGPDQGSGRPREGSVGVRYRVAGGMYDRYGADGRHRPYRADDCRRNEDNGDDERVDERSGRKERCGNLHDGVVENHHDKNSTPPILLPVYSLNFILAESEHNIINIKSSLTYNSLLNFTLEDVDNSILNYLDINVQIKNGKFDTRVCE